MGAQQVGTVELYWEETEREPSPRVQAEVQRLVLRLVEMGAERVVLFGSRAKRISRQRATFTPLVRALGPLDAYYVPTRYPNGLPGGVASDVFQEEDSERALKLATGALEEVAVGMAAVKSD